MARTTLRRTNTCYDPELAWAPSDYDATHMFKLWGVWSPTIFKDRGLARKDARRLDDQRDLQRAFGLPVDAGLSQASAAASSTPGVAATAICARPHILAARSRSSATMRSRGQAAISPEPKPAIVLSVCDIGMGRGMDLEAIAVGEKPAATMSGVCYSMQPTVMPVAFRNRGSIRDFGEAIAMCLLPRPPRRLNVRARRRRSARTPRRLPGDRRQGETIRRLTPISSHRWTSLREVTGPLRQICSGSVAPRVVAAAGPEPPRSAPWPSSKV